MYILHKDLIREQRNTLKLNLSINLQNKIGKSLFSQENKFDKFKKFNNFNQLVKILNVNTNSPLTDPREIILLY